MDRRVDVLVIGGGVAAARFVRTLRRRKFGGSILLATDEPMPPYNRPPLSKELLRGEVPMELVLAEPEGWWERQGVELRLGDAVTDLDAGAQRARLHSGEQLEFGHALLATGAKPRSLPVPGGRSAMLLRTVADSQAIRRRAVEAARGGRAVMIGGGFIGVEVAASLAEIGLSVTLVEASGELWAGSLGEAVGAWARRRLEAVGVEVRLGAVCERVEDGAVVLAGERLPADLLVAGVGVTPRTELAEAAGLRVDDGVVADERAETSAPGIFAAGDVARAAHPLDPTGRGIRVEHWHAARESGEAAALALLGEPVPARRAPWVYTEFAGQLVDHVGWAPSWDEERVLPGGDDDRFGLAFIGDGRVTAVASVNGAVPVEDARPFVERQPPADQLWELVEG